MGRWNIKLAPRNNEHYLPAILQVTFRTLAIGLTSSNIISGRHRHRSPTVMKEFSRSYGYSEHQNKGFAFVTLLTVTVFSNQESTNSCMDSYNAEIWFLNSR